MIAIPVFRARVAPVLDWCSKIIVIPEDRAVDAAAGLHIEVMNENMFKLMQRLREQGIRTLICGALSAEMLHFGLGLGLEIIDGIAGDIEEVLDAYSKGSLDQPRYRLPGCRGRCRYKAGAMCTGGKKVGSAGKEDATGTPAREGIGPGGFCVCPACGAKKAHERGIPCSQLRCSACNGPMTRE